MAMIDPRTGALFSDALMDLAAGLANTNRNAVFRERKEPSYPGPIIVAEGDSWFCYPSEIVSSAPRDIVRQLGSEFAVSTEAKPGDVAHQMRDFMDSPGGLLARLDGTQPDILLLSAGGNDLLGKGKLSAMLRDGDRPLADYFKTPEFSETFWGVVDDLEAIIRGASLRRPGLKILTHGYDYTVPTGNGPWLQGPLTQLRIPRTKHQAIVDRIVDWFNAALLDLARRLNTGFGQGGSQVFHVDLRGSALNAQWYDELHPSTAGFKTIVTRFRRTILKAHPMVA